MKSVFILWHIDELEDQDDDYKLIGVYATREDAERAINRTKDKPGFCDQPDGFVIDEYEIGMDHWQDGYFTVIPIYVKNISPNANESYITVHTKLHPKGVYEIFSSSEDSDQIELEFQKGDKVICEEIEINPGEFDMLAVKKATAL
jgi:hypothetical protein